MSKQAMKKALDALERGEVLCEVTAANILRAALDAPVEPVGWATSYEIENVSTGFSKDLPCRSMSIKPAFPKEQVVLLYTTPPDTEGLREDLERVKAAFGNEQLARFIEKHGNPVPILQELERVKGERDAMAVTLRWMASVDGHGQQYKTEAQRALNAIAAQGGKV